MADRTLAPSDRRSRVREADELLLHADLHNHSLLSDGLGDPAAAFAQMRAAGLDAAALTDHASIPHSRLEELSLHHYPDEDALALARTAPRSIDDAGWRRALEIADDADVPGEFTAIRGFEWTEPWLGHVNVWFSDSFLPVTTPGRIDGLHDWLVDTEPKALFGYNHPGREPGRLGGFAPPPVGADLADRLVTLEAFNRGDDYLFWGCHRGLPSPLVACLDARWRPGLVGNSDEHGRSYGLVGKGRTGVWAPDHSREGLRDALAARRTFATREPGLRLDATLDGAPMGSAVAGGGERHDLAVDLGGSTYDGRDVELQVLVSGPGGGPAVVATARARVGEVTRTPVTVPSDAAWAFLRVADPSRRNLVPGPSGHPANAYAVAYASPWWFTGR